MEPKFFTVEQANQLITFFESTLERVSLNRARYLKLQRELAILKLILECGASESNPDTKMRREKMSRFKMIENEIKRDLALIKEAGCVVKDIDRGMVDFYSIRDETFIFLCWKKGEDSIKYWHPFNETCSSRRPLLRSSST
jgi:hypothetical protein